MKVIEVVVRRLHGSCESEISSKGHGPDDYDDRGSLGIPGVVFILCNLLLGKTRSRVSHQVSCKYDFSRPSMTICAVKMVKMRGKVRIPQCYSSGH